MKGIRTDYTERREATINKCEWESIGKLNVITDEINRALGRSTKIEEPRSNIRIARPQIVIYHG
jgi:hypothetical protein